MAVSDLILRDGDGVRASGRVLTDGDEVWFEPPLPVPLVSYSPGHEPPPRPSGLGVPVLGVDLSNLDDRRVPHGVVDGWATLTGTWQRDRLVVQRQEPRGPAGRDSPRWTQPPCPAPEGGWPEGRPDENLHVPGDLRTAATITSVAMFRPGPRQRVLVVAAEDPEWAESALRPRFGDRVCVVRSRWTARQIEETAQRLREGMEPWLIYGTGQSVSEDGQPVLTAALTRVLPPFAEWAGTVPDGLLRLTPWLVPRRTLG